MTSIQIPATQNDAWGFWGAMGEHAEAAWSLGAVDGEPGRVSG
ncbi:hypothetical protein [Dokdonella sp.]|nr:hypothetical protein [Dokdonella sp.]